MASRTVEVVTAGVDLSCRNRQLVIRRDGNELGQVPFEDLGVLILSGFGARISTDVLRAALAGKTVVLVCDNAHLPAGLLLPLEGNALHAERLRDQIAASIPLRKRLWSRVVAAKIRNQAANIPIGDPTRLRLTLLARRVRSGDPQNLEAQASRSYWARLFSGLAIPAPFRRDRHGPPPNGLLNYGYVVLRAAVARAVCGGGLHPAIGLGHSNRSNSFALADDLMEPLRPCVDREVLQLLQEGAEDVCPDTKRRLLELLDSRVVLEGQDTLLTEALARCVASLVRILGEAHAGASGIPASVLSSWLLLPEQRDTECA